MAEGGSVGGGVGREGFRGWGSWLSSCGEAPGNVSTTHRLSCLLSDDNLHRGVIVYDISTAVCVRYII